MQQPPARYIEKSRYGLYSGDQRLEEGKRQMINFILLLLHGKWYIFIWADFQDSVGGFRKQVVKARRNLTLSGNSFFHVRNPSFRDWKKTVLLGSELASKYQQPGRHVVGITNHPLS